MYLLSIYDNYKYDIHVHYIWVYFNIYLDRLIIVNYIIILSIYIFLRSPTNIFSGCNVAIYMMIYLDYDNNI